MPLNLGSITNDTQNEEAYAWILQRGINEGESVFVTEDQKYLHIRSQITDRISGRAIGRIVYTVKHRETFLEIEDIDIVWNNAIPTCLHFNTLKDGSSDACEYYEVETMQDGQHLEIETVNRHVVSEDILGTKREVYISAFPFELSVYADMDAFNQWAGFGDGITVGNTEFKVGGFSERFAMPGGMFRKKDDNDESYSFMIGRVISYQDVEIAFGQAVYPFILAQVDTALGVIPVSMSREVFDLANLKEGCVVAMNTEIKADLAKEEDFKYPNK